MSTRQCRKPRVPLFNRITSNNKMLVSLRICSAGAQSIRHTHVWQCKDWGEEEEEEEGEESRHNKSKQMNNVKILLSSKPISYRYDVSNATFIVWVLALSRAVSLPILKWFFSVASIVNRSDCETEEYLFDRVVGLRRQRWRFTSQYSRKGISPSLRTASQQIMEEINAFAEQSGKMFKK